MNDAVTWTAVAVALGSLLSILKFYGSASDRLTKAEARGAAAESSAQAASILAQGVQVKIEGLQKEFADYREAAAIKFVSDRELVQVEQRFSVLVESIQRDIRGVAERLDRVLEHRQA